MLKTSNTALGIKFVFVLPLLRFNVIKEDL